MPAVQNEQDQILTIDAFKTMNRKVKQELLPPDTAYTCQNLRYDEILGMLYKRPSRRKYNSTTLGTDPIKSQVRYYKNSDNTKYYVIATSTFLKVGTDSAGTFTNIKTGLTANQRFIFVTFKDKLYCFNGSDNNQVYDGENDCVDMGVPIPDTPTIASGGTGVLTGVYSYKVTYMIDSYQEGSSSSASTVLNASSNTITVTIPVSTNVRVTHRKIYRTKAGKSVYYLVATISNNTATTYNDNIADASLGVTEAPTDYGAPGSYKYGILVNSRVFLARNSTYKSRIIFSDIRNGIAYPDVFPANNYLDIAKDDGDEITGIADDGFGNFVVWKTNSVRILHIDGDSPTGWSIGKPLTTYGNIAPYCLVKTPIGVVYMTRFGENKNRLMLWAGMGIKPILAEVDPILDDIDQSEIVNTVGHFHNGKIHISYTDTSEIPTSSIDTYTKLLLHFNGTDGSTTFTDSETTPKTVTAVGDAQIDTAQQVFGTGSGLFQGTGYLSLADHADWDFDGDFTIEMRVRFSSISENQNIIGNGYLSGFLLQYLTSSDKLQFNIGASSVVLTSAISAAINTWYAIAVVRIGSTVTVYLNGVNIGSGTDSTSITSAKALYIGEDIDNFDDKFYGWMDELRISKGIGRYTGNYTPSVLEYGYGYNNKVLIIDANSLQMINIDDKSIDSFSNWNAGTDVGELYSGSSNADGFCYEEETDTSPSESTIEIEYQWGKLNFGYQRLRKRLKQVKIEFVRTVASGTLSYYYALDGGSEMQVDISLATYASAGYYIYRFPLTAYCFYVQPRLYSNSDISALGIKRLTYVYSLEPYVDFI